MKIIYLCIVIVVSCSVCASGDLEIYPGLKFDFSDEDSRNRLREYESREYFPFQNANLEDLEELEARRGLPEYDPFPERDPYTERITPKRHYREDVDWKQYKVRNYHKNRQHHDVFRPKYIIDKDGFPVLSEPKMYHPRPDFEYQNGNEELDIDGKDGMDLFPEKLFRNAQKNLLELQSIDALRSDGDENGPDGENDEHHVIHQDVENEGEQVSPGRFKDVKTAENPTEFAYVPPDPRFYRSNGANEKDSAPNREPEPTPPPDTPLQADRRSELRFDETSDHTSDGPASALTGRGVELVAIQPSETNVDTAEVYVIAVVAGISAAATVGLIAVGIGWYNLRKHVKNAQDVDYPAYGITGPNKDLSPSGDRRLAQSAQMYHYQHQKQQIIAMERAPPGERNGSVSDGESDEENEEGDYTVYECPGLAPTGEMEVKNPLFQDDPTPAQTPAAKTTTDGKN
ncbi:unnamed protein product [Phaedon cochleariae]|uniref:Uncharacterized protein n=1 Tax=Phaedon cochleariae TaxID=80249 RepID=A0A9P0DXL2_PHACE|nr:unnamed protein product [Phaedon cochleariae]